MPTGPVGQRSAPILVDIEELVLDDPPRSQLDDSYVRSLARAPGPLPAIVVHMPTRRVVDGRHRVRAAILRGERQIAARLCFDDAAEIFALAVAVNAAHGHPIPIDDRKRHATALLARYPQWSTRRIAVASGLAPGTVGRLRGAASPTEVRVSRNGRKRAVDTGRGRRVASAVLAAEPGISLREAARKAGISPSTVRDVRNRMRQAGDPVTPRPIAGGRAPSRSASQQVVGHLRVAKLCTDPALRYTLTGRRLLAGLLAASAIEDSDIAELARSLPTHCIDLIAAAAADCARTWQEFADTVRRQHSFPDALAERRERVGRAR
jgi:transposase-like protein